MHSKAKRQLLDKAVKQVHTDKMQVDDVMNKLPEELHEDFLNELRRRGGDAYAERGPDGRGAGPQGSFSELKKMLKKG